MTHECKKCRRSTIRRKVKDKIWQLSKMSSDMAPCYYCGRFLLRERTTLDHFQPLALGGSNRIDNLVIACSLCNKRKKEYTGEEFLSWKIQKLLGVHSLSIAAWMKQKNMETQSNA